MIILFLLSCLESGGKDNNKSVIPNIKEKVSNEDLANTKKILAQCSVKESLSKKGHKHDDYTKYSGNVLTASISSGFSDLTDYTEGSDNALTTSRVSELSEPTIGCSNGLEVKEQESEKNKAATSTDSSIRKSENSTFSGARSNRDNKENLQLHSAVKDGDIDLVKGLIESGADVNKEDEKGRIPAYYAVFHGHKDIFDYLYELDDQDKILHYIDKEDGSNLLKTAVISPNQGSSGGMINSLLVIGVYADVADKDKKTPLWYAIVNSNVSAVIELLFNGKATLYINKLYDYKDQKVTMLSLADKIRATTKSQEAIEIYNKLTHSYGIKKDYNY